MFVIKLTYRAPLAEIDRLMPEHVEFLRDCFRGGVFIAGGRQTPRAGGVILARASSREDLDEIMSHDPFVVEKAADYEIIEFRTSFHHPGFAGFADPGTQVVFDVPDIPDGD